MLPHDKTSLEMYQTDFGAFTLVYAFGVFCPHYPELSDSVQCFRKKFCLRRLLQVSELQVNYKIDPG